MRGGEGSTKVWDGERNQSSLLHKSREEATKKDQRNEKGKTRPLRKGKGSDQLKPIFVNP